MNIRDLALIEETPTVYLSTIDSKGFPSTRAMLNLRNKAQYPSLIPLFMSHKDRPVLYFTTNGFARKMCELAENPKASAYFCDPARWHGVMLQGELEVVADTVLRHTIWQNGWETYYKGGVDSDEYVVLRFEPSYISSYYQFQRFESKI